MKEELQIRTMFGVFVLSLLSLTTAVTSNNVQCGTDDCQTYIYRVPKHSCECGPKRDGILRYHDKKLQICDGKKFVDVGFVPAPPPPRVGSKGNPASSCNHVAASRSEAKDGYYYLKTGGRVSKAYCYMGDICGSKGWVMIMKIHGRLKTFEFDSSYWRDKVAYNPSGAESGLGHQETKLDTYWTYRFHKLCLGMNTSGATRWLTVNYDGTSLYDVIAPGGHRSFHVGRKAWKNLIPGSSLQRHCNLEGFNAVKNDKDFSKARIGIIGNQENNCDSADSRIGFGTGGGHCGEQRENSAGNEARCGPDNGDKSIYAFGYILAQ